jgi:hypothetical protein
VGVRDVEAGTLEHLLDLFYPAFSRSLHHLPPPYRAIASI